MSKKPFVILFIIIILGLVAVLYYRGGMFSKEILKVDILGPDVAKVGEEIEYTVQYKNNGNFVLQNCKLTFELPDNSLTEDGKLLFTQNLKDIYPGDQESVKFKGRLLGKDGDLKTAKAYLSYVPENITATYESDTTLITKIDASAVTVNFDLPAQIEQGKNLQYTINYLSAVDYPLENLSIKIDPTPGFDLISAVPTSLDNSEWKLKTLNKDQGGKIDILGNVSATSNQSLAFSASLGKWQSGNFIVIKQATATVRVVQPSLTISQQINGSDSYSAVPGETLNYKILFKNIGSVPFNNLFVQAKLDGSVLDMSTVRADSGQVRFNDGTIFWDYNETPQLGYLNVQQKGEIDFSVKVKDNLNLVSGSVMTSEVNVFQSVKKFTTKINPKTVVSNSGD